MKNKKKQPYQKLSTSLLIRLLLTLFLYTFAGIILYVVATTFYNSRTWYEEDLLYRMVHWIDIRQDIFFLAYILIGYITIFLYYWKKPFYAIRDLLNSFHQVYQNNDNYINLPDGLSDIESQLNHMKFTIKENQRIAKEAEQRKNDLVVYLAHDLKTPLTSVIGYLTLLHDENQISEELKEKYVSISLNKAQRLEELINEFFEITRFNLSNISLEISNVNLARMLEQILFEFKPMLAEKGLGYLLNCSPEITINFDTDKMQRVFDNLLRNAVNYSFNNCQIEITVTKSDKDLTIIFANHGHTIPEEKLERIFEQFYRLDISRTSQTGGAGLGLAIAKEIVESHGGSITAQSANEMITFMVTLPLS